METEEKKMLGLIAKLSQKNLSKEDIEFAMSFIKDGKSDPNLKIMPNSSFLQMSKRGIWESFIEACREVGIVWTHSNEPER